ncbi:MAG: hypothetical protein HFJ80_00300 [Clostridiales bacterium]|nr:hypothetical protein [Clostridiales bacterium]
MPATIAHYLFTYRVLHRLKRRGMAVSDFPAALIGTQGPDIFFFHRVMPWQPGISYASEGRRLHRTSPARLFEAFRTVLNAERSTGQHTRMQSYVEGFFCHYALDRAAHPYVYWFQEELRRERPQYGKHPCQYHFCLESALDTLVLRRDTGRRAGDFRLPSVLPPDEGGLYLTVGRLYQPVFRRLLGTPADAERLALAPGDMRRALALMTDRFALRRAALRPVEMLSGRGHFATSLLRPLETSDWDYANESGREWRNPFDETYASRDSFYELYDRAADEAANMIAEFREALPGGKSMAEITQDRGFATDLPGIYRGNSD